MEQRFSQRIGKAQVGLKLQVDDMDEPLRNCLWNCFLLCIWKQIGTRHPGGFSKEQRGFGCEFYHEFLRLPLDSMPDSPRTLLESVRKFFFEAEWFKVYNFLEFVAGLKEFCYDTDSFVGICNCELEKANSAYRFVGKKLSPITSKEEAAAVEECLKETRGLAGVNQHLTRALELLSDRESPDYRNSIKESISAVESLCGIATGKPKGTLGECLDKLKDLPQIHLHPALLEGFKRIYGWTSDEGGIRHALTNATEVQQCEDAKFMLVACSAFINYLIEKFRKAGVSLQEPGEKK